jgi:hypothetical protein
MHCYQSTVLVFHLNHSLNYFTANTFGFVQHNKPKVEEWRSHSKIGQLKFEDDAQLFCQLLKFYKRSALSWGMHWHSTSTSIS